MISNKIFTQGDSLIIEANAPIVGLISLLDWVDTTVGENSTNYFFKEYRVSGDGGLNWTNWKGLSEQNLTQEAVSPEEFFLIQYKYTKFGDNTSEISFDNVTVFGQRQDVSCPIEYNNSIFKQFFDCDDVNVLNWCINVTKKLYERGIVPNYIDRNKGGDDSDYMAYWSSVACFFAMVVNYGRQFQTFYNNPELLVKYLETLDINFNDSSDISAMKYYMENALKVVNQRGTLAVVKPSEGDEPNGELLQIINFADGDEFIIDLVERDKNGWWLDGSSPLYKSSLSVNKFYERTFTDLGKYKILNAGNSITVSGGNLILSPASTGSGIDSTFDTDFLIPINNNISYEFSLNVKRANGGVSVLFGMNGADPSKNKITMLRAISNNTSYTFGNALQLNAENVDYRVTGIINKSGTPSDPNSIPNSNTGYNLTFRDNCEYIQPFIICNGLGDATISNVEIKPLGVEQKDYNGIIQPTRRVNIWCVNRGSLSNSQVKQVIEDTLINYNQELDINFID